MARQAQSQLIRNFRGDFLLHDLNVCELAIVLSPPELRYFFCIHQFRLDVQTVAPLNDFPHEYRTDVEILSCLLGVYLLSLVAKCHTARHYSQVGQLSKAIDQALGNAVAEVLGVGIAAHVCKWQDSDRIDLLTAPKVQKGARSGKCNENHGKRG